jgi:hypothetical protein
LANRLPRRRFSVLVVSQVSGVTLSFRAKSRNLSSLI